MLPVRKVFKQNHMATKFFPLIFFNIKREKPKVSWVPMVGNVAYKIETPWTPSINSSIYQTSWGVC